MTNYYVIDVQHVIFVYRLHGVTVIDENIIIDYYMTHLSANLAQPTGTGYVMGGWPRSYTALSPRCRTQTLQKHRLWLFTSNLSRNYNKYASFAPKCSALSTSWCIERHLCEKINIRNMYAASFKVINITCY